jgi:hypothetical protein
MVKTTDAGGYAMTLYELSQQFDFISNMEDADPQTIADTLESLEGDIQDKLLNIGRYVRNIEAEADSIKTEEKRLADKRRVIEKKVERLKDYVADAMKLIGKTKVNDGVITWSLQMNPPKVVVDDESSIPVSFVKQVITETVDKNAIKQALQGGNVVPGCHLEQEQGLRLK